MRLVQNVGHGSDVGRMWPLNEDYHRVWQFPLADTSMTLLAVADGMGGAAGEVASRAAMEVLDESFSLYAVTLRQGKAVVGVAKLVAKAICLANRRVYAAAVTVGGRLGMGTTPTLVAAHGSKAYLGHVGDSRAYLVRGDEIYQLTKDRSWVEEQLEKSFITEEEAKVHEWRNLITRALGTRARSRPTSPNSPCTKGIFSLFRPTASTAW